MQMGMRYRALGKSGIQVSEVGFGAWAIGGNAYGRTDRCESRNALARAEEFGCNFVDTAMVYGDSELLLGEFLVGRRSKWRVSTKYSGQPEGLEATLNTQLKRLRLDAVDLYLVHWAPSATEQQIYEQLYRVKKTGKARLVGVSLYSIGDISFVLANSTIDALMIAFSVLDPDPFLAKLESIRKSGLGVLVRSTLKEGFLTGKFANGAAFLDDRDQRHRWDADKVSDTIQRSELFRFLEHDVGSMTVGAACYPLCFQEVSTVLLGTKTVAQAEVNFGKVPDSRLSKPCLDRIGALQRKLGLLDRRGRVLDRVRSVLGM